MHLKTGAAISLTDIVVALVVSLICALIIHLTYRFTFQGVVYQKSFNISIVMASLITTSIIMVISGNLVLSLGMVGALSIVRFRTALKDPLDIIFIFWAISAGIANGVANFKLSITASLFFALVMFIFSKMKLISAPFLLIVKYEAAAEKLVIDTITSNSRRFSIKTKTIKNGLIELTSEVRLRDNDHSLLNTLDSNDQIKETALLAYTGDLSNV